MHPIQTDHKTKGGNYAPTAQDHGINVGQNATLKYSRTKFVPILQSATVFYKVP